MLRVGARDRQTSLTSAFNPILWTLARPPKPPTLTWRECSEAASPCSVRVRVCARHLNSAGSAVPPVTHCQRSTLLWKREALWSKAAGRPCSVCTRDGRDTPRLSERQCATHSSPREGGEQCAPRVTHRAVASTTVSRHDAVCLRPAAVCCYDAGSHRSYSSSSSQIDAVPTADYSLLPPAAKWYKKRITELSLSPEELRYLSQHLATRQKCPHFAPLVLACASQLPESNFDVITTFNSLRPDQQADVIRFFLRECEGASPSLHISLDALITDFLSGQKCRGMAVTHLFAIVSALNERTCARMTPTLLCTLLQQSLQVTAGALDPSTPGEARARARRLITLAAAVLDGDEVASVLDTAGYLYEAAAFRSAKTFEEPPRRPTAKGVGNEVYSLLSQPSISFQALKELCDGLPRRVARFTVDLAVLSAARQAAETPGQTFIVDFEQLARCGSTSALELASRLHFVLFAGTKDSAALLLPRCKTRRQLLTVMKNTCDAGVRLTLQALRQLLELRPSDLTYALLYLTNPRTRRRTVLLFDVQPTKVDIREFESDEKRRGSSVSGSHPPDLRGAHSQLRDGLRDVLPPSFLETTTHSVESLLRAVPTVAIPQVLDLLPHVTGRTVSWWASTLLREHNTDAAFHVLKAAAARFVIPDMWVLVELLESNQNLSSDLEKAVRFIRGTWPDAAPVVFRAFVERAATVPTTASTSEDHALRVLSAVSVLGLLHYPSYCLEVIAERSATHVVHSVLELIRHDEAAFSFRNHPAPLHVSAFESLVEAVQTLGYEVEVDVVSQSAASKDTSWWSSHGLPRTERAVSRLFKRQVVGLWAVALQEVLWTQTPRNVDVHKALQLVCCGCRSSTGVVSAIKTCEAYIIPTPADSEAVQRRRRRKAHADQRLLVTLTCACEVLTARGYWREAIQLVPLPAESLPPLLKVAKLRALRHCSEMSALASIQLEEAERQLSAPSSSSKLRHSPRRMRPYYSKRPIRRPTKPCRRVSAPSNVYCQLSLPRGLRRLLRVSDVGSIAYH